MYFVCVFYFSMISDLKYYLEKNHETLCVKKREIQYYAMIRMRGFVLPMQKSEGVLSEGFCLRRFCPRGFCPEGVVSAHQLF